MMTSSRCMTRRSFLAASGLAGVALSASGSQKIVVGLELYSVRGELAKDLTGTVRAVAKMGYQVVEFFSPYYSWSEDYAKQVRGLLDDLGIKCNSTHNGADSFTAGDIQKAIDLNRILGTRFVVMASPPPVSGLDGWKKLADQLSQAVETLKRSEEHTS